MLQSDPTYATSILSIGLLGNFRVHYQEKPINGINTSRLQSLLAYLVLHREAPLSRQHLAFLFWPDSSEAQARTNLRNLLHKLRAALPESDRHVSADQNTLHWKSRDRFTLDVDDFLSLASHTTSIQHLKDAVTIYTGDFMPDCYDEWAQAFRENIRQTYLNTLEKIMFLLNEARDLREALTYGLLLLRHEPAREETYRLLMRLYAQCGDRASIARMYKTCTTVLERELGVEPSAATDDVYEKSIAEAKEWSFSAEKVERSSREPDLNNLPAPLTSFIGREQELKQVNTLLSRHRLLTLSGPGGIGKTRLALAAAREMLSEYRDGIFLIDLVPINPSESVTIAIADALQASDEVRAAGLDGLIDLLSDQNVLLLLDNCEHLPEEVGTNALALLQACPDLRILATSRGVLNVYGETVWQVPALPTPGEIQRVDTERPTSQTEALLTNESVTLFIERALSTLPTFRPTGGTLLAIGKICRRLEGMPLAIEMAAAKVKTLTVHQIVERLDNVLDLLKPAAAGALPRHRTMEAVMDWSYAMLVPSERDFFARLSVFSGGFSLQAAEKICQGQGISEEEILELLASLVDKSLVETLPALLETRFRLHEIARQYARKKLDAHEHIPDWQQRHMEYFVCLAEEGETKLRGADQLEWLDRLELERENLRDVLQRALEEKPGADPQNVDFAARLTGALWLFWFIRGHFSEGRRWSERALALLERTDNPSRALGRVLYTVASFYFFQGDFSQATLLSKRSLSVCKAHQDPFGQVVSYHHLGAIVIIQGDLAQGATYLNQGLKIATETEDAWLIGTILEDLGFLAIQSGDRETALKRYRRALEIGSQMGDTLTILYCLTNLAELALEQKDLQQAAMLSEESLSLSRLIGEKRGISFALERLGRIAMQEGQHQRAGEYLKGSLQIMWGTRDRDSVIEYLVNLADYEVQQENFEIAARLLAACESALTTFPADYRLRSKVLYDRLVDTIRACLDTGVFTAAWTLGRLMNLDQAVNFALIDRSPDSTH
jgi:predicted ATPase/DNA-binding SARP family transcriptional activator/Tfp pilus assembly protein PilF